MLKTEHKPQVKQLCRALATAFELVQGHIEIHIHQGEPRQVHVMDKSLKYTEEEDNRRNR